MSTINFAGTDIVKAYLNECLDENLITKQVIDFAAIQLKQLNVFARKNHDYGDAVGKLYELLGSKSILTRIGDKYFRLVNLLDSDDKPQVSDESVTDTLLDLSNYAIIAYLTLTSTDDDEHVGRIQFSKEFNSAFDKGHKVGSELVKNIIKYSNALTDASKSAVLEIIDKGLASAGGISVNENS